MKIIEDTLRNKLNINEIGAIEIDQEFRKDRF